MAMDKSFSTESFSSQQDSDCDILGEDEMEHLFKLEVTKWLQTNGKELFQECFQKCVHLPARPKVTVPKKNVNNVNTK